MTLVPDLNPAERRRVLISQLLDQVVSTKAALIETIFEAKNSNDHAALGYASWTEYVADSFGGQLSALEREDLRLATVALADAGMSSRAIAKVTNLSDRQVRRDIARGQVGHDVPPDDVLDEDVMLEPYFTAPVTGLDGKKYSRSTQSPPAPRPRRRSLPDAYWDAMRDLEKAARRLERLTTDDRFKANRETIHRAHYNDFKRFHSQLYRVRKAMNGEVITSEVVVTDE